MAIQDAVREYLRRCFATEESPRVSELAANLGMSRERLSREFMAATGISLSAYLKEQQIVYAQRLLAGSHLSTTRIAYRCGFGTRRTFYRAFRRSMGMSPDQFRRQKSSA